MIEADKLSSVAECDGALKELRHRLRVVVAPSSRGAALDDVDAVLDRRLHLREAHPEAPKTARRRRATSA